MDTIPAIIRTHLNRIQIVHQIPGRLRLYIPLLEGLSSEWCRYQLDLVDIIKLKEGVVDIELSIITGRVLIVYEPLRTDPTRILQWFKTLSLMLYEAYIHSPIESKQQIAPFLKKLRSQFQHMLQPNGHIKEVA